MFFCVRFNFSRLCWKFALFSLKWQKFRIISTPDALIDSLFSLLIDDLRSSNSVEVSPFAIFLSRSYLKKSLAVFGFRTFDYRFLFDKLKIEQVLFVRQTWSWIGRGGDISALIYLLMTHYFLFSFDSIILCVRIWLVLFMCS